MSRKFLCLLILIMFISIGVVSASDNLTDDVVGLDNNQSIESIDISQEVELTDSYGESSDNEASMDSDVDLYDAGILKPTKLTTTYNSGKTFNVKVVSAYDKSYTLEDVRLKLRVYTKNSYKDYYAYTNYNGVAKFKVSTIALGTHDVQISSADSYTSASKVTSTIKINKANTKVAAPKVTSKQGKSKKFKVTIKNKANNKAVKYVKISVKVGSKTYNLKTNSKGVATFNTKSLKSGTYKVVIKSKNSNYNIYKKSVIVIKSIAKKTTTKKKSSYKSTSSSSGGYYVASVNSNKFHYPSCSAAKRIKSYNKITFSSRSQALNAGYSSCGICHP